MEYRIISASRRQVGLWAGGTTEQLYIWPEGASYAGRDFAFRVSTAQVELERSDFTPLPGITRWIMPLEGHMELVHQGHGGARLAPLEAHRFEGGWATCSAGRCSDFNLMLAQGWQGRIWAVPEGQDCPAGGLTGVFAFAGPAKVALSQAGAEVAVTLAHRDFLVLNGPAGIRLASGQAVGFAAWPQIPESRDAEA